MMKFITFLGQMVIPFFVLSTVYPQEWIKKVMIGLVPIFILKELLLAFRKDSSSKSKKGSASTKKLKVLSIDDDPVSRNLIKKVLKNVYPGSEIKVAADGDEGLRAIAMMQPDIILCDMLMNKMNGNEMVETIKKRHPMFLGRIIVLSSLNSKAKEVTDSIFLGCDYIQKPLSNTKLKGAIERVLIKNGQSQLLKDAADE